MRRAFIYYTIASWKTKSSNNYRHIGSYTWYRAIINKRLLTAYRQKSLQHKYTYEYMFFQSSTCSSGNVVTSGKICSMCARCVLRVLSGAGELVNIIQETFKITRCTLFERYLYLFYLNKYNWSDRIETLLVGTSLLRKNEL